VQVAAQFVPGFAARVRGAGFDGVVQNGLRSGLVAATQARIPAMAPGPLTTASRGGNFYNHRAFVPSHNRALNAPLGRAYPGPHSPRQRFAVSTNGNGGHQIALDDNEAATLTVAADGSLVIEVQNKAATNGAADGGNAGNAGGAVQAEPAQMARSRTLPGQRNRMSWERDPASGGVTFTPGSDELLEVDGDSVQAVVTAHPTSPPG
jgi:hypothetical protein